MESTWENRDRPVLVAAAEILDREHSARPDDIAQATGLEPEQVQRALRALSTEDPPLLQVRDHAAGVITRVFDLTGEGRRRAGAWPSPDNLAGRLVEALGEAAERTPDPQERTRLKEAAKALVTVGQAALAGVIANVLTGSPLGPAQ